MKKLLLIISVSIFLMSSVGFAFAGATTGEAKAMVEKAEAYYKANGKEKTLKEINNPKGAFVKGELYVFAFDINGVAIAHPYHPYQIGLNLIEVPDVDGKYFRKEALEMVKKTGSAWTDYKLKNPKTNKVELKTSYWKKVGDIVLGCGAYK